MNLRAQNRLLHEALTKVIDMTTGAVKRRPYTFSDIRQLAARAISSVDVKPVTAEEKFADAVATLIDLPDAERERACRVARELSA
jgi:hypothetical protein